MIMTFHNLGIRSGVLMNKVWEKGDIQIKKVYLV